MNPNYKNWMPKRFIILLIALCASALLSFIKFTITPLQKNTSISPIQILILFIFLMLLFFCIWSIYAYNIFSYKGKRKLSKQIIEGIADHVHIPDNGKALEIGCGSGALTIACAKRNPNALVIGLDKWGIEYSNFSKKLCEENAKAENIQNVEFVSGDAVKLNYPDEYFDVITSNYVYHNIKGTDKKQLLLESLRVLKKGGTFVIHDIMSKSMYGDINEFIKELKSKGYKSVDIIDTTNGKFMSKKEARFLFLKSSRLLLGTK